MADINDINAAQTVKIVGSDSTGVEQTPVASSSDGQLKVQDLINSGISLESALTVNTTATEVKVGSSPLLNRKVVTLYNNSNETIYWGFTSSVSITSGSPIERKEFISWSVGDNQSIYIIAGTDGLNSRITEAS